MLTDDVRARARLRVWSSLARTAAKIFARARARLTIARATTSRAGKQAAASSGDDVRCARGRAF